MLYLALPWNILWQTVTTILELATSSTAALAAGDHLSNIDTIATAQIVRLADMISFIEVLLATDGSTAIFGDLVVDAASAFVEADFGVACRGHVGQDCDKDGQGSQEEHIGAKGLGCEHAEMLNDRACVSGLK